ncbi:MAG TPA: hypothetical protein VM869_34960, partial [Enhygromyxa sp.]|nr:hypothetical protein [Enhygromyxa sp.]
IQRAAMLDALPPEVGAFVGMTVDLYGPAGRQCTVTLDTLTVEAHLEMAHVDGDYVRPGAEALWESLATTEDHASVLLVASFAADPRCAGALWARDASLPAPDVLAVGDPREHAAMLAEEHGKALATEAGQKFVHEYQEFVADPEFAEYAEPWASASKGLRQVWIDQRGVPQLVILNFGDHSFSPCHWRGPSYGVARQVADDPASSEALSLQARVVYEPAPVAVFDADLDGRYELLFLQPWGDLTFVEIVSLSDALQLELMLPDNSYVWC